uniref:O-fucosyltransferase family protein n=1 Tax=Kalanchoe fedtschenkoi TaxID=63787 RepID=A0A7N0U108_KALFE
MKANPTQSTSPRGARKMAELRHSSSVGRPASSPLKREADASPLLPEDRRQDDDDDDNDRLRHTPRDRYRRIWSGIQSRFAFSPFDESRVSQQQSSRISLFLVAAFAVAALISIFSLYHQLTVPYLCKKEGIVLRCPQAKEAPSLWENPYSATTSWKPCAERRDRFISDLPPENETNGYIFIHAEGGLNQQRIAICNAVAVAKIMNATLILPVLKQDQIWKDQTKFEDIFDVDHFIDYLKDDVRIVRDIPDWFTDKTELFTSIRALHLRFEKGMVGLSFCDFVGTRDEKAKMAEYRKKEWPRRYKNGSHLWQLALQKRKEGRCPLEPSEVAVILRAMGYPKDTQIYVASGQVYGGQNRMAPLRNMFRNLVTKEELASKEELDGFRKHVTSLAALDFLVCLKSDVFVMTHGGNFAKLIIGARRYMGHRLKSIKPDKGLMAKSFGDPYMGWATFAEDVVVTHQTRTGLPEETFPNYDLWENPLTPCMCRA